MSIARKAFKGASWLALFRLVSQTFSWGATIIVARLLVPQDFGLMEMATILTGYVVLFSELGLGSAVIQSSDINQEELSSLFWFLVCWGFILAIAAIILAYPTVLLFSEPRLLRITQSTSILFITGTMLIVPVSILNRELKFKALGFIDAVAVIAASACMVVIAKLGGGVWTLIGGNIIREIIRTFLIFFNISWKPYLHFQYKEIEHFLKFGVNIAGSNSMYYVYTKSDRFFCGRLLGPNILGYYSLALQLSSIPTDKIVSLINSVSYPVYSRYQDNLADFRSFYLKSLNLIAFITMPLFTCGIFLADQLIPVVLGPKWFDIILPFKVLCVAQLIICITSSNATVFNALGMPRINLYISTINLFLIPISFYISAHYGLIYLAIPWITVFPFVRFGHTWITLRKLNVSLLNYLRNMLHPALATIIMLLVLIVFKAIYTKLVISTDIKYYLALATIIGVISYASYLFFFQKSLYKNLFSLLKRE